MKGSHPDQDVCWADTGLPVRQNRHGSDLHRLTRLVGSFVGLDEGGHASRLDLQLRGVGEDLDRTSVAFDL